MSPLLMAELPDWTTRWPEFLKARDLVSRETVLPLCPCKYISPDITFVPPDLILTLPAAERSVFFIELVSPPRMTIDPP